MPIRNKDGTINFEVLHNCYPELEKVVEAVGLIVKCADDAAQLHAPRCDYENNERAECCCWMSQLRAALAALREKEVGR